MEEKRALLRFVPAWNGPVTAVRPPDRGLEPAPYRFGRPLSRVPFEACWPDARTTRARPRPRLSSPSHRSTSILSSIHISSLSLSPPPSHLPPSSPAKATISLFQDRFPANTANIPSTMREIVSLLTLLFPRRVRGSLGVSLALRPPTRFQRQTQNKTDG